MHFYVEKLKVSNFLSFFGEFEINLKPYTAVMCNYYEGKADFLKALEFVFGGLGHENLPNLVHYVYREEILINRDIQCYVEAVIYRVQENKRISFRKTIKKGKSILRVEHKMSDVITSRSLYEEELNTLNLDIKEKNLIFSKRQFDTCIWGSSENLEMIVSECLRKEYLLDEWKKARNEVRYWIKMTDRTFEKNYKEVQRTHRIVSKFANNFKTVLKNRISVTEELIKSMLHSSFDDRQNSPECSTEDCTDESQAFSEAKLFKIDDLEAECEDLKNRLIRAQSKTAFLTSHLLYNEIKIARKPVNTGILQDRVAELKKVLRKKEEDLAKTREKMKSTESNLETLSLKITYILLRQNENQVTNYLQNRFTVYGRFVDYLQPNRYTQMLKEIIGDDIYYAHLCDSMDNAINSIDLLKLLRCEQREKFIIFNNYSYHLRDLLTASGERGIEMNNLEELLIFLCKLAHFEVIDDVPAIAQKNYDFDGALPPSNIYTLYLRNYLHFTSCGLISYKFTEITFCLETQEELEHNLIRLKREEEIGNRELEDLIFTQYEIRLEIINLENDILYVKEKLKSAAQTPPSHEGSLSLVDIYNDYEDIFNECEEERKKLEEKVNEKNFEESLFTEGTGAESRRESTDMHQNETADDSTTFLLNDLDKVHNEEISIRSQLEKCKAELRKLNIIPVKVAKLKSSFMESNNFNKSNLFFEKELKRLRSLTVEEDIEDFLHCEDWRKSVVKSITREFAEIKKNLDIAKANFRTLENERNNQLLHLLEHCKESLSTTFHDLLADALPFIDLNLTSDNFLQISSSLASDEGSHICISNFNTFLRFVSILSLFLEISRFNGIPLLVFDNMDEYFPQEQDTLEAVFSLSNVENLLLPSEDSSFHLAMRIGQYFSKYIEKNTMEINPSMNGKKNDRINGPMQVILFDNGDMIHSADHYIWIHCQTLPDEYVNPDCNVYSEIREINVDETN